MIGVRQVLSVRDVNFVQMITSKVLTTDHAGKGNVSMNLPPTGQKKDRVSVKRGLGEAGVRSVRRGPLGQNVMLVIVDTLPM